MEIREFRTLRGPNIWANSPVVEAWVDLGDLKDACSNELPGFNGRLMSWLPTMIEHRCSVGERGGFFQRLRRGTYAAHIMEHVSLELLSLAGVETGFGKSRETSQEGFYRVVVKYDDEALTKEALRISRELYLAAVNDKPFDVPAEIKRLHDMAERVCLGPSTRAIVDAAAERCIPSRRLNDESLVLLGQGVHARRIWTAESDRTSAIAEAIAADKDLTKSLLRAAGIPVPEGRPVDSAEDAWDATERLGSAVVIKPRDANHGRAVFAGLTEKSEVEIAFEHADREGNGVIVERFVTGAEHRLLVVGGKLVAAARGDYAYVVGDGKSTIAELVESQLNSDPRRGDDESCPLNRVVLDAANRVTLEQQGYEPESVLLRRSKVLIQRSDNLATDVTDEVHPRVAELAVQAAKVVGLDIAGIDILARDIGRPLEEQGAIVVEVNSGPGLLMHLKPARGKPQPVGQAIVATLFPEGSNGRVPVVAVAGSHGTAETTRLIEHLWHSSGLRLGVAASYGQKVGDRWLRRDDAAVHKAQREILINPKVEAALFEITTRCALSEGLGFDRCQVAVVTNVDMTENLDEWYFDDPDRLVQAKRVPVDVVLPEGYAVLNADDPAVLGMAEHTKGRVLFFTQEPENPAVDTHCRGGGKAVFLRGSSLHLVEGSSDREIADLAECPGFGVELSKQLAETILAATAAAWALGLPIEQIVTGLKSFVVETAIPACTQPENQ
jgi:cyanophycin synthetase